MKIASSAGALTKRGVPWLFAVRVAAAFVFLALRFPPPSTAAMTKVTVAVSTQVNRALMLVASAQNRLLAAGVDDVSQPFELDKDALKSVLDGKSDHAKPDLARRAVGDALKLYDATMAQMLSSEDYTVALEQAMPLALGDQPRWAMQKGLVATRPMPNYHGFMKYQHLESVRPTAVPIVH